MTQSAIALYVATLQPVDKYSLTVSYGYTKLIRPAYNLDISNHFLIAALGRFLAHHTTLVGTHAARPSFAALGRLGRRSKSGVDRKNTMEIDRGNAVVSLNYVDQKGDTCHFLHEYNLERNLGFVVAINMSNSNRLMTRNKTWNRG